MKTILTLMILLGLISSVSPVSAQQTASAASPGSWITSKAHSVLSSPVRLLYLGKKSSAPQTAAQTVQPTATPANGTGRVKKTIGMVGSGLRHSVNGLRSIGRAYANYTVPYSNMAGHGPHGTCSSNGSDVTTYAVPVGSSPTMSTGNVVGGQNLYYGNGTMTTTMPNVFGGQNVYMPNGSMVTTMPNVFGGYNFYP